MRALVNGVPFAFLICFVESHLESYILRNFVTYTTRVFIDKYIRKTLLNKGLKPENRFDLNVKTIGCQSFKSDACFI